MNILLIEDDIGLVELITGKLEESGSSVISAATGAQALAELKKARPDMILLDYSLPDVNGKELIELLNQQQVPSPPFIITTGRGDERIAVDMMKLGAIDYLIKDKLFLEKLPEVVKRGIKEIERDGKLKQAEEELKQSVEKYRGIFDQSAVGTARVGLDGTWLEVNHKLCEIVGYTQKELQAKTFQEMTHPDDLQTNLNNLKQLSVGEINTYTMEKRYYKKNGDLVWVNLTVSLVRDSKNNPHYYIAIIEDITEKKKMEEQLRQSQKMDAIGQLAGGVAHDFNNMLSGILGSAELILYKAEDDEKLKKYANLIIDSCSQAAELTQKLLSFSHKDDIYSELFDIHDCIKQIYSMLYRSIDKRIEIQFIRGADLSNIHGDHSQIQNALLNLGLNARDAMPDGGKLIFTTRNITFDIADIEPELNILPGEYIEIDVEDTGTGMSSKVKSRVFDPFFTTKGLGKGTGLGLSVAYNTIKVNQGFIKIYSELGLGTVMKVYFPVALDPLVKVESRKEELIKGQGSVLVVDDESTIRFVVGEMLSELGYMPSFAANGEECIELYKEESDQIDLVILDMVMPKMNGRDVFYELKAINPDVKVLISSGFTEDMNIATLFENGASGFIKKPYKQLELSKKIGEIL